MPHPRCPSAQKSSFSLHTPLQTKNLLLQYLVVLEAQQILNHSGDLWANNCSHYAAVASAGDVAAAAAAEDVVAVVGSAPVVAAPAAASVA